MRASVRAFIAVLSAAALPHSSLSALGAMESQPAHRCTAVEDPVARLACYDAAFGRKAVPGELAAAQAEKAKKEFGLTEVQKRARDPQRPPADVGPPSIEGTVASLRAHPTDGLIVTLDDGQVWIQSEALTNARLKVGDRVTIRKGALGSHQLVTDERMTMRVRRLR